MTDIVITEFMDEAAVQDYLGGYSVLYDPKLVDDPPRLLNALSDCRALIVRNRTQVRAAVIDVASSLRVVGRLGVGLDNIDVAACTARGIKVFPATGANDLAVAEYVLCATMMLLRRAWLSSAEVASGAWPREKLIGQELAAKKLGLIGFGAIARLTASKARALGMPVAAYDPFVPADDAAWLGTECLDLPALLSTSDVISLHIPLTPQTRHLIDAAAITTMKQGALVVNAARGGVIDEEALVAALRCGRLGGAAIDVFEREPMSAAAGTAWQGLNNVILTPHIAGVTAESNIRVSQMIARTVRDALLAT
ncbi:MAG: hydroxyacid dehydrogenase [Steroidobacteraceae bacterium]